MLSNYIQADEHILLTPEEKAWIEKKVTVRIRAGNTPPFMFTEKNETGEKRISGIAIEYINRIFKNNGIRFKYLTESEVTWTQALMYIRQHEVVDMVPTAKVTEERKKYMLFTDDYIFAPWVIFTRSDSDFVNSIDDLKGKRVSVEEGYVIQETLKREYPEIKLDIVSTALRDYAEIPVKNLSTGIVDAYIGDLMSTTYIIQSKGYTNIKVAAPTPFGNHNQAMGIRNDWPELVSIINKSLKIMTKEEHASIRNRWLNVRYEYGIAITDVIKWVSTIAITASILIELVLVWNRRLKAEVTFRKKIEKDLQESQRIAHVGSWRLDIDTNTVFWSEELYRMYGFDPELPPPPFTEHQKLFTADSWTRLSSAIAETMEKAIPYELELQTVKDNKSHGWMWVRGEAETDSEGIIRALWGAAQDITERRLAEDKNQKLQAQLIQAQKIESIGRLAGGVAHDFNNMLTVILGNTEMVMDEIDPSDPHYENLEEIHNAAKKSQNLTRQLLGFARKQIITPRVLDINSIIADMLKMLKRLIGENIDLKWLPSEKISPVEMDPSQIDQILANLCINARDAIRNIGKITIETADVYFDETYCGEHAGFHEGQYVMVAVSDNGSGMDKDTLNNIFEPFFTTKDISKGSGLGLATVYGIIRQNNGFINVYSELGEGTVFKIYLPQYVEHSASNRESVDGESLLTGNERILVVEDQPSILKMAKAMLERLGYDVITASTPIEALVIAKESGSNSIDLLITDVVMPEMNGRSLSERLIQLYPDIKCLFMSGYTANVIAHHGVLDSGVEFINKPFSKHDLAVKVRQVLDSPPRE